MFCFCCFVLFFGVVFVFFSVFFLGFPWRFLVGLARVFLGVPWVLFLFSYFFLDLFEALLGGLGRCGLRTWRNADQKGMTYVNEATLRLFKKPQPNLVIPLRRPS